MYTPQNEEERAYLADYDASRFPGVALTSDLVMFTIRQGRLSILLIERGGYPYKGYWALPGGFVQPDEDADTGAARELLEETGVDVGSVYLEQLKTYTQPDRDPRMRVVSVAYVALLPSLATSTPVGGDDASDARWWAVEDLNLDGSDDESVPLAFDHETIIRDGLRRIRSKFEYTDLATQFLDERFTLGDLRRIYEVVWGAELHPSNFRRKVLSTPNFVVPVHNIGESQTGGRSAQLYQAGGATQLHPPLLQPGALI